MASVRASVRCRHGAAAICAAVLSGHAFAAQELDVSGVTALRAALARSPPGTLLRLAAGEYPIDAPLQVPDGVTVSGSGATLRADGRWQGAMLTLGHRSVLRGLRIVDATLRAGSDAVSDRNVVVVASRRRRDRVAATIRDCEIETDQPFGVGRGEPLGRAIVLQTRNPHDGGTVHAGARVALLLERSTVLAPRSNALFAANFAPDGRVQVDVRSSRLSGTVTAVGGVSRPDPVTGARTRLRSARSRYSVDDCNATGWQLFAGSGVAHQGFESAPGADHNRLTVESIDDHITGYRVGIVAAGGRRVAKFSGPSSGNLARLKLRRLAIETCGNGAADLHLAGARLEAGTSDDAALSPGDRNRLVVAIDESTGSGVSANRYRAVESPATRPETGVDNRLRVEGSLRRFGARNSGFDPMPARTFFDRP